MGAEKYINGDKYYGGTTHDNPMTPKQIFLVDVIEKILDIKLTDRNSHDAYSFINKYYEPAGLHRIKIPKSVCDANIEFYKAKKRRK